LILNDHTPGVASLIPMLEKSGYFDFIIQVPFVTLKRRLKKEKSFLSRVFSRNAFSLDYVESYSSILKYDEFIRNAEINLFYNQGLAYFYFLIKYKSCFIRMVEDGERNYNPRIGRFKAFFRRQVLRTAIGEGFDPEVKEIEVQHTDRLNKRIAHKGKKLELNAMRDRLSQEQQQKILGIFLRDANISVSGDNNLILITQPLNDLDEPVKIALYNQLLGEYSKGYSIYLKAHPRELTDYAGKIQYPFTEIPRYFPLEMMNFMNSIQFKRGVTVFSSSLYNLQKIDERVFVGEDYLKAFKKNLKPT
jgi:hypothetical protein